MTPFYLIHLRGFRTEGSIGFHDVERRGQQPMVFSVVLMLHDREEFTDRVSTVVDYDIVRETILAKIEERHWDLLESLCSAVADNLISTENVLGVIIRGAKTDAYDDTDAVSCHLARLSPSLGDAFPWWSIDV